MEEFKIDPSTGLPEPPVKGVHWEVRKVLRGDSLPVETGSLKRWAEYFDEGYYLLLLFTEESENTVKIQRNPKARFWNREPREVKMLVPGKHNEYILNARRVCLLDEILGGEAVRQSALNICNQLTEERLRHEAERKLVGKYPPNKLGA